MFPAREKTEGETRGEEFIGIDPIKELVGVFP